MNINLFHFNFYQTPSFVMHIALSIFFIAHGIAHLVGFVVPWRIATMEEMPYKTSILNGKLTLGDNGIRIYGLFWLILAMAFLVLATAILLHQGWWVTVSPYLAFSSLLFCLLSWPDARIGILINLLIIFLLPYIVEKGWFLK